MADTTSLGNSPQKYMIFALGLTFFLKTEKKKKKNIKKKKIYVKCIFIPSFLYLTTTFGKYNLPNFFVKFKLFFRKVC